MRPEQKAGTDFTRQENGNIDGEQHSVGTHVANANKNRTKVIVCPICGYSDHTTAEEHERLRRRVKLANRLDPSPTREEKIKGRQDTIRREHGYPHEWENCLIGFSRDEIFTPEFVAELEKAEKEAREAQRQWVALLVDPTVELPADSRWPRFPQGLRFNTYPLPNDCVELLRPAWARIPATEAHFDRLSWIALLLGRFDGFEGVQFLVQELEHATESVKMQVLLGRLGFRQVTKFGWVGPCEGDIQSKVYETMSSAIRSAGRLLVFHPDTNVKKAAADAVGSGWVGPLQENIRELEQRIEWYERAKVLGWQAESATYAQKVKTLRQILEEANQYTTQAGSLALSSGDQSKRLDAAQQLDISDAAQRSLLIQSLDGGSLGPVAHGAVFLQLVMRRGAKEVWKHTDLRECVYRYALAMSEDKEPKDPLVVSVLEMFADQCEDASAKELLQRFPKEPSPTSTVYGLICRILTVFYPLFTGYNRSERQNSGEFLRLFCVFYLTFSP